ncbi:MAG: heavy metal-binding domain-containing protein [Alphaproteobacteria bacterium]|nr:heavy metal-binding domain-containing protein [Alphaproteobacteria bacterium]
MIVTTTDTVEGRRVATYLGVVSSDVVLGSNVFKDFFASVRDWVGGRVGSYEKVFADAKKSALEELQARAKELGADAVVGVDLDYQTIGGDSKMLLMVAANGTAVKLG